MHVDQELSTYNYSQTADVTELTKQLDPKVPVPP